MSEPSKFHTKIPTGRFSRARIVGLTSAQVGAKKLSHLVKTPFLSEDEKTIQATLNDKDIAKLIFSKLGYLKGTFLKIAQAAALEIEFLPQEIRSELLKSTNEVPPLNKALIRKVIKSELGDYPENIFKIFHSEPFAAASLGQVHLAETLEGLKVAVKVQYPGVAESIRSDLSIAKSLMKPLMLPSMFNDFFEQISEKLKEELNYELEAKNTTWFYENLKMKGVRTPCVLNKLSTKKILTTEYLEGIRIDEWLISSPSQNERNKLGQSLVDVFKKTNYDLRCIHSDPNLGNYLVQKNGSLAIIDFGCITKLPYNFAEGVLEALSLSSEDIDKPEVWRKIYNKMEIEFKKDFQDPELLHDIKRWYQWISKPNQSEYFNISEEENYMADSIETMSVFKKHLSKPNSVMVYSGRANQGLLRLLQLLKARVQF